MKHRQKLLERRQFLQRICALSALPFLESLALPQVVSAQMTSKKLKRLVVIVQPHMPSGYHRVPEFCRGAWGNADPSRLQVRNDVGLRTAVFGSDAGGLGSFYNVGLLGSNALLRQELMAVNGLAATYSYAGGHLSNGGGALGWPGVRTQTNGSARFALSGAMHEASITVDQLIARKIHRPGQVVLAMGGTGGDTSTLTDESIDASGSRPAFVQRPPDIFNGGVFGGGARVTQAINSIGSGGGGSTPTDPKTAAAVADYALVEGLESALSLKSSVLADAGLSAGDRSILTQHYDMLDQNLLAARAALPVSMSKTPTASGDYAVAPQCANPQIGADDISGFLPLIGSAFLCDLSRVVVMSCYNGYTPHEHWHEATEKGAAVHAHYFNRQADWLARTADFLQGLIDPTTGRGMLESTLVLGITNNGMGIAYPGHTDGGASHAFSDMSYVSIGGSLAFNTGSMYDALGPRADGGRGPVSGGVWSVNQYLQTIAAAFGLTSTEWAGKYGQGFGPWFATQNDGRPVRADVAAKTSPMPLLLKA